MDGEFEVLQFEEIEKDMTPKRFVEMLKKKSSSGFKVSILLKRILNYTLSSRKNHIFGKWKD
jgi:hypothetical protein